MLGDRIRAARINANLNQSKVAEAIGVNAITVSRWERGVNTPGTDVLKKVAKVLGVTMEWLVDNDDTTFERLHENAKWLIDQPVSSANNIPDSNARPIDLIWVPVVTSDVKVCCGAGNTYPEEVTWGKVGLYPVPKAELIGYSWQTGDNGFKAITVEGDSMEPQVHDGALVLFVDARLNSGDIGIVLYKGRLILRGVIFEAGGIRLKAANPDYEDIMVSNENLDDIYVLGKMLGILPKFQRKTTIW